MMTRTDLFAPAEEIDDHVDVENDPEAGPANALNSPIAVPCGFRDRYNNPCSRRGNWPIMADGKQVACRSRPMVHCDPACFKGEAPVSQYGADDDDIVWDDRVGVYDDEQAD